MGLWETGYLQGSQGTQIKSCSLGVYLPASLHPLRRMGPDLSTHELVNPGGAGGSLLHMMASFPDQATSLGSEAGQLIGGRLDQLAFLPWVLISPPVMRPFQCRDRRSHGVFLYHIQHGEDPTDCPSQAEG